MHAPLPRDCISPGPTQLMPESTCFSTARKPASSMLKCRSVPAIVSSPDDDGNDDDDDAPSPPTTATGAGRLIGLGCSGTSTVATFAALASTCRRHKNRDRLDARTSTDLAWPRRDARVSGRPSARASRTHLSSARCATHWGIRPPGQRKRRAARRAGGPHGRRQMRDGLPGRGGVAAPTDLGRAIPRAKRKVSRAVRRAGRRRRALTSQKGTLCDVGCAGTDNGT